MAVTGPDFVALQVRDLERSARFYTEQLGLRRAPASPPGKADGGIDTLYDDLAKHGVTIVTAPFDGPFGRTFAFADPDGYVITVHG